MDVVLLCIEQQFEGLDLASDLNLADFGGVVQPPSQWCLAWERFILLGFFSKHVGFVGQRLLSRGNSFLIPCFRWKNWRGLFTACHCFVSLIYVLDVVAQLRFLGWTFWKLIGSALAPSTAG